MDCEHEKKQITAFIKKTVKVANKEKVVIGLSGGIDSSLVATLAVEALGHNYVHGVIMPYKTSSEENVTDAINLSHKLGIEVSMVNITNIVDAYSSFLIQEVSQKRKGNIMSRVRMSILYDYADVHNALVIGTTNYTELLLGYFTKYGDGGVDFEPIADLYKREVVELARYLGVNERIIEKKPTADLWVGQTDEGELGMTYKEMDEILSYLNRGVIGENEAYLKNYSKEQVDRVKFMILNSEHKRNTPAQLSLIELVI